MVVTTIPGLDIAYPPRDWASQLAALGYRFIGRYCPYFGDQGKSLTREEADIILAAGMDILMFFQTGAESHRGGRERGIAEAQWWLAGKAHLGIPDDVVPVFCVDFDAQPVDYPLIAEFQLGAISVLGLEHVGIYGHDRVIDFAAGNGLATTFVQCVAYSRGRISPHAMVFQDVGPDVLGNHIDHDTAFAEDFGQWKAGGLSVDDRARLDRLERLLAGNGIAKDLAKPDERTTGEEALAYADQQGWSAFLGLGETKQALAMHEANHPSGGKPAPGTTFTVEVTS